MSLVKVLKFYIKTIDIYNKRNYTTSIIFLEAK